MSEAKKEPTVEELSLDEKIEAVMKQLQDKPLAESNPVELRVYRCCYAACKGQVFYYVPDEASVAIQPVFLDEQKPDMLGLGLFDGLTMGGKQIRDRLAKRGVAVCTECGVAAKVRTVC